MKDLMVETRYPGERVYRPAEARRILRSAQENGDLLTDLLRLTCMIAIEINAPTSERDARAIAIDNGASFDRDGWFIAQLPA